MAFWLADRARIARWLRVPLVRWMLRLAVRIFARRHCAGAVGAVFNDEGRVLLVEHVFRTDFAWGLPGGWINAKESPAETVRRETAEELQIIVDVRRVVLTDRIWPEKTSNHPAHLGVGFYCRLVSGSCVPSNEVLSVEWADPDAPGHELAPFQAAVMALGKRAFEEESSGA